MERTKVKPEQKKQHPNTRYWNLTNTYPIRKLLEYNADEIKKMNLLEKKLNIPALVQTIIEWGTTSQSEAIGVLEIVKDHFVRDAIDFKEHEEVKEKKIARRIT